MPLLIAGKQFEMFWRKLKRNCIIIIHIHFAIFLEKYCLKTFLQRCNCVYVLIYETKPQFKFQLRGKLSKLSSVLSRNKNYWCWKRKIWRNIFLRRAHGGNTWRRRRRNEKVSSEQWLFVKLLILLKAHVLLQIVSFLSRVSDCINWPFPFLWFTNGRGEIPTCQNLLQTFTHSVT